MPVGARGRASAALAVSLWLAGCGEPPQPGTPLRVDGRQPAAAGAVHGSLRDAEGLVVEQIRAPAEAVRPGARIRVEFRASAWGRFDVSVRPPRDVARQVARGGPEAPPVRVAADPRGVTRVVEGSGRLSVELDLASPWHPTTAVVTIQRRAGSRLVPVVEGPRLHDGTGVLAVVPVARTPTHVGAVRAKPGSTSSVVIDGSLDDSLWRRAKRTTLVDSYDGTPVRLGARNEHAPAWGPTEVAFGWDVDALYVAAWLPDEDLRATFTERDQPLWHEDVFEVFVFGDARRARYLELQVSPAEVYFDARFDAYREGDPSWNSRFQARVALDGTLEQPADRDRGWTAELSIPWDEVCTYTEVECPVTEGQTLRVNTFRLERPRQGAAVGLALSPTRVRDFHAPENAAVLQLLP